jgi:hypothetical protein
MSVEEYSGTVCLLLPNGWHTLVSAADFDRVATHRWQAAQSDSGKRREVRRNRGPKKKTLLLHRVILDAPDGVLVDHINGNPLDNRRENLRLCSRSENSRNQRKLRETASKYKGVSPNRISGRFRAFIWLNNKQIYLGTYMTEIEAALAYNEAARRLHGEFASPNVIDEPERAA